VTAERQVSYRWRLRELMAGRGMFTTSELVPLLAARGISLSVSQVHRLVTGIPERLSLAVLAALCDILDVTPADLIATDAQTIDLRKAGTAGGLSAVDTAAAVRPRRARVRPGPE
jgi:DNA-binding Xre family transcriptional regulator